MPPTAPVPAPGRYDARRATRLEYAARLGRGGWASLPMADRRWLDALYWGPVPRAWPTRDSFVAMDDPEGPGGEALVPSLGGGRESARSAPLARTAPDVEPLTRSQFARFRAFWRWWIATARGRLEEAGALALEPGDLAGAPLIKVVPPRPKKGGVADA